MKGDISRNTFDPKKHRSGVRLQQGRVQLDSDLNELGDITWHRIESGTLDEIGVCGMPLHAPGFGVLAPGLVPPDVEAELTAAGLFPPDPGDFVIGAGRAYVDGIQCENEDAVAFSDQPDLPVGDEGLGADGTWLAYLDVWKRHETPVDDPLMRETALGGPDTATRSRTVWQVRTLAIPDGSNCQSVLAAWADATAPSTGLLRARAEPPDGDEGPCIVPPAAGYRGLENQLYRVEVQVGGNFGDLTFKWSRDNGSIESEIVDFENHAPGVAARIVVADTGKDAVRGFAPGQWIEVSDDRADLDGHVGALFEIDEVDHADRTLTVLAPTAIDVDLDAHPRVRRWDHVDRADLTVNSNGVDAEDRWMELEQGVEVRFDTAAFYRPGDYWLIPARTATSAAEGGHVEWPTDAGGAALERPAEGIHHHYCRLAVIAVVGDAITEVEDCRNLFPPLTELVRFHYLEGDGQEGMPDPLDATFRPTLAAPLRVGVSNGQVPVIGAEVRFSILGGADGRLDNGSDPADTVVVATTGAEGAAVTWSLDPNTANPVQQVEAVLLDHAGDPTEHPPIRFNANLSLASRVAYAPIPECPDLGTANTVQDAIDLLCLRPSGSCGEVEVRPGDDIQQLVDDIPPGADATICFHPGEFPVPRTIRVNGKGRVVMSGRGRLVGLKRIETVVAVEACAGVHVEGLSISSTGVGEFGEQEALGGVLDIQTTEQVSLSRVQFGCGSGARRMVSCLKVTAGPDAPPLVVDVRDCHFDVGNAQTGVLLIDPSRAEVEGNRFVVRDDGLSLRDLAAMDSVFLTWTSRELLDQIGFTNDLPTRPGHVVTSVRIAGQRTFVSVEASLEKAWTAILTAPANRLQPAGGRRRANHGEVRGHLRRLRRRVLSHMLGLANLPDVLAGQDPAFAAVIKQVEARTFPAGGQGIVVGGDAAGVRVANDEFPNHRLTDPHRPDVLIAGNSIVGFTQGIHVGLSRSGGQPEEVDRLRVYRARIVGNTVGLHVPHITRERHGIYVGSSQSTSIRENMIEMERPATADDRWPVEGIRVWGVLGPLLMIRENHIAGCSTGVRARALNSNDASRSRWAVGDNVNAGGGTEKITTPAMPL